MSRKRHHCKSGGWFPQPGSSPSSPLTNFEGWELVFRTARGSSFADRLSCGEGKVAGKGGMGCEGKFGEVGMGWNLRS